MTLTDYLTSVLRTVIPTAWGAAIAWLVGAQLLPAELVAQAEGFAAVLVAVAIALYYVAARALEPHLPGWATRLLLGSAQSPAYDTSRHTA